MSLIIISKIVIVPQESATPLAKKQRFVMLQLVLGVVVGSRFDGFVAKWLRQRIANPLFPGSSPGEASL